MTDHPPTTREKIQDTLITTAIVLGLIAAVCSQQRIHRACVEEVLKRDPFTPSLALVEMCR